MPEPPVPLPPRPPVPVVPPRPAVPLPPAPPIPPVVPALPAVDPPVPAALVPAVPVVEPPVPCVEVPPVPGAELPPVPSADVPAVPSAEVPPVPCGLDPALPVVPLAPAVPPLVPAVPPEPGEPQPHAKSALAKIALPNLVLPTAASGGSWLNFPLATHRQLCTPARRRFSSANALRCRWGSPPRHANLSFPTTSLFLVIVGRRGDPECDARALTSGPSRSPVCPRRLSFRQFQTAAANETCPDPCGGMS